MTETTTERDPLRAVPSVVILWLFTRALTLVLMQAGQSSARGDVAYYQNSLTEMLSRKGVDGTLVEYPLPAVGILRLPQLFGDSEIVYSVGFFVLMALLDVLFTVVLYRYDGRRRGPATTFWLFMIPLMGPVAFNRFDLVPAIVVGLALLVAARHPRLSGGLVALGAAVKLWPAVLFPVMLARRTGRVAVTAGFVVTGVVAAGTSWAVGGWDRLISPLTWQSERGLQIESVWATPHMVLRALEVSRVDVDPGEYGAWEVFGPGVSTVLTLTDVATLVGFVVIAALTVRALRAGSIPPAALALMGIAITAVVMTTGKTLSPQYLLWLGGPVAAALALAPRVSRELRLLVASLLVMAALSQLIFPVLYNGLVGREGHALVVLTTVLLLVRNVLLVAFTVVAVRTAWRSVASADA